LLDAVQRLEHLEDYQFGRVFESGWFGSGYQLLEQFDAVDLEMHKRIT
jgi:hypothetical protein